MASGGIVRLSMDVDDFISPSLACTVKPMQIEERRRENGNRQNTQSRVLKLEGLDTDDTAATMMPETGKVAKVTLNDCLACSGCVTSAETVLITQQSMSELMRAVSSMSPKDGRVAIVSVSPAVRAAMAVHFKMGLRETFERLTGLFHMLGCHHVVDTGVAGDLCLVQMAAEFVQRFRQNHGRMRAAENTLKLKTHAEDGGANDAGAAEPPPLPVLSSTCPGWICYAEKTQHAMLPYLSRVKSPQQIAGSLIKSAYAAAVGVERENVYHASLMPCYDKKLEASRDDFADADGGRDVDCVIAATEVLSLLQEREQSLSAYARAPCDTAPALSALSDSGDALCVAAPGASGGGAEHVFRCAAKELFGQELPDAPLEWKAGRNKDLRELTLQVDGEVVLRFAQAYGFRNIQNIVRRVKNGTCAYHYVELMACPAGCANGGGQPRPPPLEAPHRAALVEAALVGPDTALRRPEDNPLLRALYADDGFLRGGPLAEAAQQHLLTNYHARGEASDQQSSLTIKW